MMLVPTYVAHSKIQGLGLFATKKIYRNTPMQMDNPIFDIILTPPQVAALIPIARDHIARYAWTDDAGLKHIGVDNDKYVNHADDPNMGVSDENDQICIALRDIEVGEEITEVYRWPGDDYVTVTPES